MGSDGSGGLFGTITNHYQRFITNNTERMRIDSSGNVGIGTSSISAVDWGSASKILQIAGTQPLLSLKDTDVTDGEFQIANSGQNLYIWDAAASATRMFIKSSGEVGIGTSSPSAGAIGGKVLHLVNSGGTASVRVQRSDASTAGTLSITSGNGSNSIFSTGNKPLNISTNSTTRMTVDGSGNVLVGKTSDSNTANGISLRGNGNARFTTAGTASSLQLAFF